MTINTTSDAFVILYKEILNSSDANLRKIYTAIKEKRQLSQMQRLTIIQVLKLTTVHWLGAGYNFFDLITNPVWHFASETSNICTIVAKGNYYIISNPPIELVNQVASVSSLINAIHYNDINSLAINVSATEVVRDLIKKYAIEVPCSEVKQTMNRVNKIYSNFTKYCPHCIIEDGTVKLVNAASDAQKYWELHSTGNIDHDLILAKQMCFVLFSKEPLSVVERIAATPYNEFRLDIYNFAKIVSTNNLRVAIVVDESELETEIAKIIKELELNGMNVVYNKPLGISLPIDKCNVVFIPYGESWGSDDPIYKNVLSNTNKFDAIATTVPFQTSRKKVLHWQKVCPLTFHIGNLKPTPTNRNTHIVHL